jgi:DNA-binding transcriptional regulator GbsR (MarR family)
MSDKLVSKISGKGDKKNIFRIEKDFSINNIELIKSELDNILEKNSTLQLELKGIDNFDLSAIQLLHALKIKLKDNFTFTLEIKEELKTIVTHSGFESYIK